MTDLNDATARPILIAGGSGYIGSRLAARLAGQGRTVRILARDRSRVAGSLLQAPGVSVTEGDASDRASVGAACDGVGTAYYLVHSMAAGVDYAHRDARMAEAFAMGAAAAGVRQIVYLGALGADEPQASEHIRSRAETAHRLRGAGVPVVEFRAGPVVGPGSLPFEMVRYLTERIPIMVCPRWVFTKVQPIALDDVLEYLSLASNLAPSDRIVEIGGRDQLSYGDMMVRYGALRGLKRWLVAVPVLTPRLSSMWVHLVTPLRGTFARPIIEGLRTEAVVRDPGPARCLFPAVEPVRYDAAVRAVLEDRTPVDDPAHLLGILSEEDPANPKRSANAEGFVVEERSVTLSVPKDSSFRALQQFGLNGRWFAYSWAWRLRGWLDRLVGGPGNVRLHGTALAEGDSVGMWQVREVRPPDSILLEARARLPGQAWMRFQLESRGEDASFLRIIWTYRPHGLGGLVYWTLLKPAHATVFRALPGGAKRAVERYAREHESGAPERPESPQV